LVKDAVSDRPGHRIEVIPLETGELTAVQPRHHQQPPGFVGGSERQLSLTFGASVLDAKFVSLSFSATG